MSPIERIRDSLHRSFAGITLRELGVRADLLTRMESKYIVTADVLHEVLREARDRYDVLDIRGKRDFGYHTRYFDDDLFSSYYAHHQDRRRRFKVRTRTYLDTGHSFAEIKLKWRRGLTVKRRVPFRVDDQGHLDDDTMGSIRLAHHDLYGYALHGTLRPVLDVGYRRITLASRDEACRITIDCGLAFSTNACTWQSRPDIFVIEVKSARHASRSRSLFRTLGQRPTRRLSKYCVGMAATGGVPAGHRVRAALRRLALDPERAPSRHVGFEQLVHLSVPAREDDAGG